MDADGFLYIKGRLKNMILGPSGKNIYPEELETIINEFDSVREIDRLRAAAADSWP